MSCLGVGKGDQSRVFSKRQLRRESVLRPLRKEALEFEDVLRELVAAGMLSRLGPNRLMCTTDGDLVKHNYNDLWDLLKLHGTTPPLTEEKIEVARKLKLAMDMYARGASRDAIAKVFR